MKRRPRGGVPAILSAMVLTGVTVLSVAGARAQSCERDVYDHNGSLVSVETCLDRVTINYVQPRSGLAVIGVHSGTMLFQGTLSQRAGGGDLSGTAYVFKRGCTPAGYPVSGWKIGTTIALEGEAPVRGDDCVVERYRRDLLDFARH